MGAGPQPATRCALTTGLPIGSCLFAEQAMRELLGQRPLADPLLPADQQGVRQTPLHARPVQTLPVLLQPFQFYDSSPIEDVTNSSIT